MRYRPLGPSGAVVSAISLALKPDRKMRARDWSALVFAALENGVNAFEAQGDDPELIEGMAQALSAVERRLVFLGWRPGPEGDVVSPETLDAAIRGFVGQSGLGSLDLVSLSVTAAEKMPNAAFDVLRALKRAGDLRFIGVGGQDARVDAQVASGAFDLLTTPFGLTSGWKERNRLRAAAEREVAVIGVEPYLRDFHQSAAAASRDLKSTRPHDALAGIGAWSFLDGTEGWTAEEICIGYVLTEPSLSSVQVETTDVRHLEALARVPDRELPQGLPAQIEMARFMPPPEPPAQHRRRRA